MVERQIIIELNYATIVMLKIILILMRKMMTLMKINEIQIFINIKNQLTTFDQIFYGRSY